MSKTESRTETTKETRTETANGIKTVIQTEVRTESTIETSTETKTEVKTETKTETISEDGVKEITSETTTKSELKSDSPDATETENKQQTRVEDSSFVDEHRKDIYTQIERFYKKKQPIWKLKESPKLYFELKKKVVELSHGDVELLKACRSYFKSKKDKGVIWNFITFIFDVFGIFMPIYQMMSSSMDALMGAAASLKSENASEILFEMYKGVKAIPQDCDWLMKYFAVIMAISLVVVVYCQYTKNKENCIFSVIDDLVSEAEKKNS